MTAAAAVFLQPAAAVENPAVAEEVRRGLMATPKSLSPWLFYDEAGSRLFEEITTLPEYYLTRTERELFATYATDIFDELQPAARGNGHCRPLTIAELGAGTAAKTGILLRALCRRQAGVLYQPIDISPTALDDACAQLGHIAGLTVRPRAANYVTHAVSIERPAHARVLALYIGSSIGNFSPPEQRGILRGLREQLLPGDALLLGTDLAPSQDGTTPAKSVATLLAAYNDSRGVTAAFNRNMLARLNRELGADFRPHRFIHRALWNAGDSRMEMHLESLGAQTVHIPANSAGPAMTVQFAAGESIHTENSYKFTRDTIAALLGDCGFTAKRSFMDGQNLFAVTLAMAV